jgi:hypothetical protein
MCVAYRIYVTDVVPVYGDRAGKSGINFDIYKEGYVFLLTLNK